MSEPKVTQDTAYPRTILAKRAFCGGNCHTSPYSRWQFSAWPIPTFRTNLLLASGSFWLSRSELSASPRNGLTLITGKLASVDVDASAPLGDFFGHDEHHAIAPRSKYGACACKQSGTLMLLALGTFLAGVNLLSLQICFLGLAMAFAVPAIAWLKQSALFLVLAAVLLIGLGITFWPHRDKNDTA